MSARKPILGLALGSGAARGMAHIGVLHALAEAGLSLGVIAGASIGALVGGVYAAGRLQKFADVMSGLDWRKSARFFLEASFARSGLIEGTRVIEFLVQILGPHRIEDLHIAFAAVATDLMSGREVILSEGDLIEAIRASIAVPGIFTPVKRRDGLLADGGLVNPVPVSVCRALGADRVIAVDLNFGRLASPRRARTADPANPSRPVPESRKASAQKVFDWMEHNLRRLDTKIPDALKEWKKTAARPQPLRGTRQRPGHHGKPNR